MNASALPGISAEFPTLVLLGPGPAFRDARIIAKACVGTMSAGRLFAVGIALTGPVGRHPSRPSERFRTAMTRVKSR